MSFEKIPRVGPKIGTLGTPRGSHGTKNFFSKIFSYKVNEVYVVRFGVFFGKKLISWAKIAVSWPLGQ